MEQGTELKSEKAENIFLYSTCMKRQLFLSLLLLFLPGSLLCLYFPPLAAWRSAELLLCCKNSPLGFHTLYMSHLI